MTPYFECPFKIEQLNKIFAINKLKKSITKSTFLIDVGEQAACETVFKWIANRLDAKSRQKSQKNNKDESEE